MTLPVITPFTLAAALQAIGVAEVFLGDPLAVPGTPTALVSLGATEGNINFTPGFEYNPLTAPELTGGVAHQSSTTLGVVSIVAPVIVGDAALFARITPFQAKSGGFSFPQKVQETGCLLIPRSELGGGLVYDTGMTPQWTRNAGGGVAAAVGPSAAPVNSVWLWRCYVSHGEVPFSYSNGGKIITSVTITAMFDGTKPEGHKVYTIGDPRAATNLLTSVSTPILVLPSA